MAAMIAERQQKHNPRLQSHALDNAKQRLAAYHAANAEIIDEYLRLKADVKNIAISLGHLQHHLRTLCQDLGKVYK